MKTRKNSVTNSRECFSLRLLGNVTVYQINENNSKNGQLCTKIAKILYENHSFKTLRDRNSLHFIKKKNWSVFTENKLKVDSNNIKMTSSKNH